MRTAPDPDRVAALRETALRLSSLKDQPGWADLAGIVEREETRYFERRLKELRNGDTPDALDVKAHSLAFDLVRYLLAHPEKAEDAFSRAFQKAERLGVITEEVTS